MTENISSIIKISISPENICQEGDLNPCPHKRTRSLSLTPYKGARLSLESGALDHLAILTFLR
jgi:hypothetical protein